MTPGFKPFTVLLCSGYANALFTGKRFILWIVSSTFGPTGTWTAKQAIYNCRPERLRSELNYLTANQFIFTERPHKEWYSVFICLVQRLNCMWQIFYLLDESTSSRFNHYNRIKRSTILKTYIVAVKCKKKKIHKTGRRKTVKKASSTYWASLISSGFKAFWSFMSIPMGSRICIFDLICFLAACQSSPRIQRTHPITSL